MDSVRAIEISKELRDAIAKKDMDRIRIAVDEIGDLSKPMPKKHATYSDAWILNLIGWAEGGELQYLLDHTKNIEVRESEAGGTLLIAAIWTEDIDTIKAVLERNPDLNATDRDGRNALHNAISTGNKEIFELIYSLQKWDLDSLTEGNEDILELIGQMPEPEPVPRGRCIGGDGWNEPFEYEGDYADPVIELPNYGTPERKKLFPEEGKNCFHFAVETGNLEILKRLVSDGCKTDIPTAYGDYGIHLCIEHYRGSTAFSLAHFLLEKERCGELKNQKGKRLMHLAVEKGNAQVVSELLRMEYEPAPLARTFDAATTPLGLYEKKMKMGNNTPNEAYLMLKAHIDSLKLKDRVGNVALGNRNQRPAV